MNSIKLCFIVSSIKFSNKIFYKDKNQTINQTQIQIVDPILQNEKSEIDENKKKTGLVNTNDAIEKRWSEINVTFGPNKEISDK